MRSMFKSEKAVRNKWVSGLTLWSQLVPEASKNSHSPSRLDTVCVHTCGVDTEFPSSSHRKGHPCSLQNCWILEQLEWRKWKRLEHHELPEKKDVLKEKWKNGAGQKDISQPCTPIWTNESIWDWCSTQMEKWGKQTVTVRTPQATHCRGLDWVGNSLNRKFPAEPPSCSPTILTNYRRSFNSCSRVWSSSVQEVKLIFYLECGQGVVTQLLTEHGEREAELHWENEVNGAFDNQGSSSCWDVMTRARQHCGVLPKTQRSFWPRENTRQTQITRCSQNTQYFPKVIKDKERRRLCQRSQETEETWLPNAMQRPGTEREIPVEVGVVVCSLANSTITSVHFPVLLRVHGSVRS